MSNSLDMKFNYDQLDLDTSTYLRQKEVNMREIVGKAYTELGQELKEAQEKLSNHRSGVFEEWYTSLGLKKQAVYNMIQRYELIVQNLDNKELIEELPVSLAYEIAKPSVEPGLKQKVLDGEIKSHKQYKELEKSLKAAEQREKQANAKLSKLQQQYDHDIESMQIQIQTLQKSKSAESPEIKRKIKDLEQQISGRNALLRKVEQELESYKLRDTSQFDDEEAKKQLEKLRYEAERNTLDIRIAFKSLNSKVAVSRHLSASISASSEIEKKKLREEIQITENILHDIKLALSGRLEINVNGN